MKSIATETIMKLFIMIAVILIASSFLLKAFDIDILGFLKEKFGELGTYVGPALLVEMDPDKNKVLQFRLIREKIILVDDEASGQNFKSYFFLSDYPTDKCTILTADDNSGVAFVENRDRAMIYRVEPGTRIQRGCDSLKGCMGSASKNCDFREVAPISEDACLSENSQCRVVRYLEGEWIIDPNLESCKGEFSYVDCDASGYRTVGCEFVKDVTDIKNYQLYKAGGISCKYDYCDDEEKVANKNFGGLPGASKCISKTSCNLLDEGSFGIKSGLICDGGKWYACTKNTKETDVRGGATKWKCNRNTGMWDILA